EHRAPVHAERSERADHDAQDRGERRGLGADRHECCGRSWRPVVRVRGPLVERDDRCLEPETDGDEREGEDRRAVRDALRGEDTAAAKIARMMKTARKNVAKASMVTKPRKYWPAGTTLKTEASATTRPAMVMIGSAVGARRRSSTASTTSTIIATAVTMISG